MDKPAPAQDATLPHPHYRADIDGLRAVAVLSVVGFHVFPEWVRGGYIGVDIFFVISGYLITSIILGALARGTFDFAEFYRRRIRRIFPALLVVLIFCLAAGWYLLLSDEFVSLTRHVAAGAGFVSNLLLWTEAGYFDRAAEAKPLLHLWSLGIEEQFYIVWPLILCAAFARRLPAGVMIIGLLVASLALNVAVVSFDRVAAFYSPFTRFWELMAGGWLAYLALGNRHASQPLLAQPAAQNVASLAGIALIALALVLLDRTTPFPGLWTLLPVGGAMLLIAAGPQALPNRWLLGNRAAVAIGLISYPLYLWHWPLLAFLRITSNELLGTPIRLGVIMVSIAAAALTYLLIERPIRGSGRNPRLAGALLASVAGLGLVALAGSLLHWPSRHTAPNLEPIVQATYDWDFPPPSFRGVYYAGYRFYGRSSGAPATTLFIGDSNIEQYAPRVAALLDERPGHYNSAIFATRGACLPVPVIFRAGDWLCQRKMEAAFAMAAEDDAIDTVVLGGAWASLPAPPGLAGPVQSLQGAMAALARRKRVFLLLDIPSGAAFDPRSMFEGSRWRGIKPAEHPKSVPLAEILRGYGPIREALAAAANAAGATAIDPLGILCPSEQCPVVDRAGQPLYIDTHHMRPSYVIAVGGYLDAALTPKTPR